MAANLRFLDLPPARRALAFEQAAANMATTSVMVEKDFWVCWLLQLLFSDVDLAPHVVFKGGTSLSKVHGVIDRFSEDIDLSLSPSFVGFDETSLDAGASRTRRQADMLELQQRCSDRTRGSVAPRLESAISAQLGRRANGAPWLRFEVDAVAKSPVLWFDYPGQQATGFEYLRRAVKLELGSLTDQQPTGQHTVQPWVAAQFPAAFVDWHCVVTALELPRTFWEKATILHAEYHRPPGQVMPDHYARHYADMARLLQHPQAQTMLEDHALCARVVAWKAHMFARQWARYDLARPGTFRLTPADKRVASLAKDYADMAPMFLASPPPFDAVLAQLAAAEARLNQPPP